MRRNLRVFPELPVELLWRSNTEAQRQTLTRCHSLTTVCKCQPFFQESCAGRRLHLFISSPLPSNLSFLSLSLSCLSPPLVSVFPLYFPSPVPPPFSVPFSLCILLLQGHDGAAACAVLKSVDSFSFLQHPVHQRSLEILQRCKEEKHSKAACTTLTSHSTTQGRRKGQG